MTGRLQGKVAMITGGGSGIGAACARRFAEEGASVVACGRRGEPLAATVAAITAAGGTAVALVLDVSDAEACREVVARIEADLGRLDILINNAYSMVGAMVEGMSAEDWHANFRVTLDGTFFATQAALPALQRSKHGAIVNVSSVCGLLGTAYTAGYGAAKAAVLSFTRTVALEAAAHNIRVNCVVPGVALTPSTEAAIPTPQAQRATAAGIPLKRIADPVEVANAILFLASDEASYITGASLVVDGGKTCELATGAASMDDFDAT